MVYTVPGRGAEEPLEDKVLLPPLPPKARQTTILFKNVNETDVVEEKPWRYGIDARPPSPQVVKGKQFKCVRADHESNSWVFRQVWEA